MRRTRPAVAVVAAAGLVLGVGGPAAQARPAAHAQAGPAAAPQPAAKDVSVTLISGDRVVLSGGDPAKVAAVPGPGRDGMGFRTFRTKDHSYVIPADAVAAVGKGQLDSRLFDVAELVRDGYDDAQTSTIPVLTTYAGSAKRAVPPGAKVTRQLPSIGAAAMKVNKASAAGFLKAGFAKVWLDGKRQVTLDQSVPQIGGPVAWQAGYTGKGISVAVLDTGIDATHPDLATQVVGEKNFTSEPNEDLVGHGTHVASTIAGTGAASGGRYRGVAPDARLYDGKVCERRGCPESAILAGMEWAATDVKAKIVNLSLGGTDTPDLDPLEEAVNRLTAQTGTLFVIAAGNDGPKDHTVGSPGSADAALTVGNVTKQDELAWDSSQGPRVGDSAMKPDVTAPGTDIVAAKSKDSTIGEPVGDQYLRLSGTSMATPHTAGAAAILLQEHPSWTPGELKSALMGSAKVASGQTAFQQGAGRIDLTTAIKQSVLADPGSLSFGLATYPHSDDAPVTKTLTYRNVGDQAVTLDLTATMTGPDGTAAPSAALTLSATTLTVPAGGTGSVQVTSNTNHNGPDGLYSGRVVATAPGQTIVVPLGVDKQVEAHTLTVKLIMADGTPSTGGFPMLLFDIARRQLMQYAPDENGVVSLQLPKGEYILDQFQEFERGPDDWAFYELVAPSVQLDADRTVVLDARQAKVVTTSAPNPSAEQADSDVGYQRNAPDGTGLLSSGPVGFGLSGELYTLDIGPKLPAGEMTGHVVSYWAVRGTEPRRWVNTPYLYSIANYQPGELPTGFDRKVKQSDLATVYEAMNKTSDPRGQFTLWPQLPGTDATFAPLVPFDLPRTLAVYADAGSWLEELSESGDDEPVGNWILAATPAKYQTGRTYHQRWNEAVFSPSVRTAVRSADTLTFDIRAAADAGNRVVLSRDLSAESTLTRDGQVIGTSPTFGTFTVSGLPAGKATYQLVSTGSQSATPFSTGVTLTATFTSSSQQTAVPIHTVSYHPAVDGTNTLKRTPVTVLPFRTRSPLKTLTIQYSDDAGATWKTAAVGGGKAIFPTPAGAWISLKSTATDAAGNTTTQTVTAAYRVS
ncbi:S8 family peptidase [Kribbella sp. NPDC026611]|uniref:S8 family peptidase n=1 Tax=Kribbella sp. NPDC026611 TaxID=3154911 RepID=UPI0033FB1C4D